MFLTVGRPICLRLPDRELRLMPGRLVNVELSKRQVDALMSQGGQNVRVLQVGSWVAWNSPLFSRCTGQVEMLCGDRWFVVRKHVITGLLVTLPLDWIVGILSEEEIRQPPTESNRKGK